MFNLPSLPYKYNELIPFLSSEALQIHYEKHHQAYLDKLNIAIADEPAVAGMGIEDILINLDLLPVDKRQTVKNFGGGYYNHNFFWNSISPSGGGEPSEAVSELIVKVYGSYQVFVEKFTALSLSLFGSGWVWLLSNGEIVGTLNQDTVLGSAGVIPLICLDLWEHSYYLDYRNRRNEYVQAWWGVVDWASAEVRYLQHQAL